MRFVFSVHGWYLGGFATFCRNLSLGLRRRGHSVVLLILPHAPVREQVPGGVFDDCVVVPRGFGPLRAHVRRVTQAIEQLRPELLVLNDSPYGMAALPLLPPEVVRMPVLHSVAPDEVALGLSQTQWWDLAVAVSEFVTEAAQVQPGASRLSLCPLGVPVPPGRSKPRNGSRPGGPLEIISVGRVVVHQKRMDRLPAIAHLLAEQGVAYRWRVLGNGDYLPQLRQKLQQVGVDQEFDLPGAVDRRAVMEALERAEVFVLPSDCEGMPQALLEAMSHGVVPVVSRIPGSTTGLVGEGGCGYLCEPSQPEEFARAIAELARNRALCAELGGRASALIARQYSLEAFTDRFLKLVAEAQAQAAHRPAPLPASRWQLSPPGYRCLGFWRSLRHQSLGELKRWLLQRRLEQTLRSQKAASAT